MHRLKTYVYEVFKRLDRGSFRQLTEALEPEGLDIAKEYERRLALKPGRDWTKISRNLLQ